MASPEPRRIAIDARSYLSSSGAYVRNLIAELQEIDHATHYDVWVPAVAADDIHLPGSNFTVVPTTAGAYTLKEQFSFLAELLKRRYDLVHFAMQQQPVFYFRPRVSTFHDLTLVYHDTTNANALVNRAFRLVTSVMFSITLLSLFKSNADTLTLHIGPTKYGLPSDWINNEFVRYAVSSDGQRFLIPTPVREAASSPLTVVLNWTATAKIN